jgi:hypothetical protein
MVELTYWTLPNSVRHCIQQRSLSRDKTGWLWSLQNTVRREMDNGSITRTEAIEILKANKAYGKRGREILEA